MKILIISYFDDNFGDVLIRICFENLLKTVLKNLGFNPEDYVIQKMHLKEINQYLIEDSDLICFAGGGLFGLSYLNFYEYLNKIINIANNKDIPVIFSSMGINNMDADVETEELFKTLLKNNCIKAISVRENLELFNKYAEGTNFKIKLVCDPAVWCKYIYYDETNDKTEKKKIVGINVVRGGLFKDNKKEWKLTDEFNYLNNLKQLLEDKGYDYRFYTNGSFLDNNTLHYYQEQFSIPEDKVIYTHSTKELVKAVSSFDITASIRMHSSIISYAFDIPSTNLLWNDKISFFYNNIGYGENIIELDKNASKEVFEKLTLLENSNKEYKKDSKYLMTVYKFLYNTLGELFCNANKTKIYSFSKVCKELIKNSKHDSENLSDFRLKIVKGEKHYLARFKELRVKDKEIKKLKEEIDKNKKEIKKIKEENSNYKSDILKKDKIIEKQGLNIRNNSDIINKQKNEIQNRKKENEKLKIQLNKYRNFFPIRIARKVKKIIKKVDSFFK